MLNDLPEDGNISDRIERIVHVVPPPNALSETRKGRSTVEGDENEDGEDREDDDLEEGPDTSGATGPIDNEDVERDQVYIPQTIMETAGLDEDQIRRFLLNENEPPGTVNNPVVMPTDGRPINEYTTPYIQTQA